MERDDTYQISGPSADAQGFYRLEAWPDPVIASVRISYDPKYATGETIKNAIVEPFYDLSANRWWLSPFVIQGYNPLHLEE